MTADLVTAAVGIPITAAAATWLLAAAVGIVGRAACEVVRGRRERLALSTYERCRGTTGDAAADIARILASFHEDPAPPPAGSERAGDCTRG